MIDSFHKFPSTSHLVWLGNIPVRGDKVMTRDESSAFLSHHLVVEEKVDGANLGISLDADGKLRFQNRGNWLTGKLTGQWERLRGWAALHENTIREMLPAAHMLFGEWCYAQHSIHYRCLSDLFLLFDVYDAPARKFWSADRRNALAERAQLATVPRIASGIFREDELLRFLDGQSAYGDARREGLYLRFDRNDWLVDRAKIVASEFTQAIADHWSRSSLVVNEVCDSPYRGSGDRRTGL